jgi:hypothetical protein
MLGADRMQITRKGRIALIASVSALAALTLPALLIDPFTRVERCKVVIPDAHETLFFRTVSWGIAGGHWQVVLSPNRGLGKGRAYDTETEYMFDHPVGLLYRVNGKTLEIHSPFGVQEPRRFNSTVTVEIITYEDNPGWIRLQDNRKNIGLIDVDECAGLDNILR